LGRAKKLLTHFSWSRIHHSQKKNQITETDDQLCSLRGEKKKRSKIGYEPSLHAAVDKKGLEAARKRGEQWGFERQKEGGRQKKKPMCVGPLPLATLMGGLVD